MKINKVLSYIFCLSFIAFTFISVIDMTCFKREFYEYEYHKNNTAETIGISEDDLFKASDVLLGYLKGDNETLDVKVKIDNKEVKMFNEREIEHMVDVLNLYNTVEMIKNIAFMVMIIIMGYFIFKKVKIVPLILETYQKTIIILGSICIVLLTVALTDFNLFWNTFHKVIFDNDLWLLNPLTDRLILMVPGGFFFDLVLLIMILFILILVIGYILLKVWRKKVYGY